MTSTLEPPPRRGRTTGRTTGLIAAVALVLGVLLCCGAFDGWVTSDATSEDSDDASVVGMAVLNFHAGRTYLVYTQDTRVDALRCHLGERAEVTEFTVHRSGDVPSSGAVTTDDIGGSYTYLGRFVADRDGYLVLECDEHTGFCIAAENPETRSALIAVTVAAVLTLIGAVSALLWAVRRSRRAGEPDTGTRPSWVWFPALGASILAATGAVVVVLLVYGPIAGGSTESTEVGTHGASVLIDSGTRYLVYVDADSAGVQCTVEPAGAGMRLTRDRPIGVPERITNVHKEYVYVGRFRGVEEGLPDSGQAGVHCPTSVSGVIVRPDATPMRWVVSVTTAAFLVIVTALILLVRVGARRIRIPAPACGAPRSQPPSASQQVPQAHPPFAPQQVPQVHAPFAPQQVPQARAPFAPQQVAQAHAPFGPQQVPPGQPPYVPPSGDGSSQGGGRPPAG